MSEASIVFPDEVRLASVSVEDEAYRLRVYRLAKVVDSQWIGNSSRLSISHDRESIGLFDYYSLFQLHNLDQFDNLEDEFSRRRKKNADSFLLFHPLRNAFPQSLVPFELPRNSFPQLLVPFELPRERLCLPSFLQGSCADQGYSECTQTGFGKFSRKNGKAVSKLIDVSWYLRGIPVGSLPGLLKNASARRWNSKMSQ
jgi:hypothetical protein